MLCVKKGAGVWYAWYKSGRLERGEMSSVVDTLLTTMRNLIWTVLFVYLVWHFVAVAWPELFGPDVLWALMGITPVVLAVSLVSLWLSRRHFLLACGIWQLGLTAGIFLAALLLQRPGVVLLLAFLPLLSAVTVGWPGALATTVGIALALFGAKYTGLAHLFSSRESLWAVVGGATLGGIGWVAVKGLADLAEWALMGFEQAYRAAQDAREQRLELKQMQEDLLQANRELARLSERLKVLNQAAEEARRAKEEFVANVSHELRTPLNMIIGFSEMLLQSSRVYGTQLPPQVLADIAAIERNSQHLARLVDDVLDLSRVEAGRMALSREWCSLADIIRAAVMSVSALFESKRLYLEVDLAQDLPPVFCDATRVRQIVINLLSNAGRFTQQGGVHVRAWQEDRSVVVSVSDTGPGIAPADQQRLFEPFQQLDSSLRRRHGGTGLGLAISKRFVEMHGGRMWLESTVGVGTTFYFSLPIEPLLPGALARAERTVRWFNPHEDLSYRLRTRPSKLRAAGFDGRAPARLLVLEEGNTLRKLLERYLPEYEVMAVHTVEEAAAQIGHSPARALVVNVPPPPCSGWLEVLQQVDQLPYRTPAIVCSVPGEDAAAQRLGVVRYLTKPVTRDALLQAVAQVGAGVRTILIVDDDSGVLQLFARMLTSAERGYRVLRAQTGQQALVAMRERHPDLVLLDLIMPEMDGFQVLEEKNRDAAIREIPVIVVTSRDPLGEPIVSDVLAVTRAGGFSVADLLACIQAFSEMLSPGAMPSLGGRARLEARPG